MNALKGYLVPAKKTSKKDGGPSSAANALPSAAPAAASANSTPGRSPLTSRPSSIYPNGDFRNGDRESIVDIKHDVMVNWLYQQQLEKLWGSCLPHEGVVLKRGRGDFICCPPSLKDHESMLFQQVSLLNVKCAMTVQTRVIRTFLSRQDSDFVPLADNLQLQCLPSLLYLPRCKKHHFAAFIKEQEMLIVWDDHPHSLIQRAARIESQLMDVIWNETEVVGSEGKGSAQSSDAELPDGAPPSDVEDGTGEKRPTLLLNPLMVGVTVTILVAALGLGWRALAQQIAIDGKYLRLAILLVTPCQVFVSLFFVQVIICNLVQIFGPIGQMNDNSKFYSGKPPRRLNRIHGPLPHVTIQMPVYKEGLNAVIQPTILSLKAAISTYEMQGGSATIFVNDDGMQLISEDDAQARREFYDEHNIGWVARPGHNPNPKEGELKFVRKGKFKKASNMNFALMISNKVEDRLVHVERHEKWTEEDERKAYDDALNAVIEEDGRAWAAGNIRVGDYILLIDSDTRVPQDCLLDAASEMEHSPEVGILQYSSGVMQVTDTFFENGITFFTNLIYTAIRFTVANGDVSPFVGHNAILRWSAIQEVSYTDEDCYEKFWSESHVSEDFDMSLRLQVEGYTIRLGGYTGEGFKEGVSLTVYDELARWEKYAYGCNELLFHPFRFWITRGPFTPLFKKFFFSNIRLTSKITICAYIGTYYAIGAAWVLTVLNYFLMGWFTGSLDHYYLDSFKVYFSLIIVFSALGNVALAIIRYRLSERSLFGALYENFKWLLLLSCFLGGISMHVSESLLSHFFEVDMSWGATAKEAENTTFFEEAPRLLKRFKWTFLFCFVMSAVMIVCATVVPWDWRINTFVAIYPVCTIVVGHFLLPIALNPALMMFKW